MLSVFLELNLKQILVGTWNRKRIAAGETRSFLRSSLETVLNISQIQWTLNDSFSYDPWVMMRAISNEGAWDQKLSSATKSWPKYGHLLVIGLHENRVLISEGNSIAKVTLLFVLLNSVHLEMMYGREIERRIVAAKPPTSLVWKRSLQ